MKSLSTIFSLAFFCLSMSLGAQDLQEGLVIHYPFEGNLTDTISGITADNNGNLTFDDGQVGSQAVRFFSPDAYFVTPEGKLQVGPAADGGTSGTFAFFVNHRSGQPLEEERHNYIAQKNGCGPDDNNRGRVVLYRQSPDDADDADELISFLSGQPQRSEYVLDTGDVWIHIALTVDTDEREWAFFIDGAEVARDTFNGVRNAENSCGEFVIGHHLTFETQTQTFDGLMDDLRFYNRVLTDQEVLMLAQQFPTATREELVATPLSISPNPITAGQPLVINLDRTAFGNGEGIQVNVMDATGRVVLSQHYDTVGERLTLDQQLTAGLYTVTMTNSKRLASAKLIVR